MKLLSVNKDAKTVKGLDRGYLTGILYLSPANESGIANLCAYSTPGCRASCLYTAGRAHSFPAINRARLRRTQLLVQDRQLFLTALERDIHSLIHRAKKLHLKPCARLNGTSDLPWLGLHFAKLFPNVQFYDYTKIPAPWTRTLSNYSLTFSRSETNHQDCLAALANGINVSVVFHVKRGDPLPQYWHGYHRYHVIDGDTSDLRFLDPRPVVVGLRAKGRAKSDTTGFVQITKRIS